ncbi:MAG: hypothetical protein HYT37_04000 [Candidatus Sungbacteria bacterium]|nr:hypothetical protein [Candidatus Sungbacteria bacterium]
MATPPSEARDRLVRGHDRQHPAYRNQLAAGVDRQSPKLPAWRHTTEQNSGQRTT